MSRTNTCTYTLWKRDVQHIYMSRINTYIRYVHIIFRKRHVTCMTYHERAPQSPQIRSPKTYLARLRRHAVHQIPPILKTTLLSPVIYTHAHAHAQTRIYISYKHACIFIYTHCQLRRHTERQSPPISKTTLLSPVIYMNTHGHTQTRIQISYKQAYIFVYTHIREQLRRHTVR